MTAPLAHGYPDYHRSLARADIIFVPFTFATTSTSVTFGPFFMGNSRSVLLTVQCDSGAGLGVQLTWTTDPAGIDFVAVESINMRGPSVQVNGYTVRGPYLTVLLSSPGGAVNYFIALTGESENLAAESGNLSPVYAIEYTGANINAGATRTDNSAIVAPGEAEWFVFTTAATFQANLNTILSDGTVIPLSVMTQVQNPQRERLFVPNRSLQITMKNNDAAAKVFTAILIIHSMAEGLFV